MKLRYTLLLAHAIILSLMFLLGLTIFTWYRTLTEFSSSKDFLLGAKVISYNHQVIAGEDLVIKRRLNAEPQGCRVHSMRYLSPITDIYQNLYIGSYERGSLPVGTEITFKTPIPYAIPPGQYLYSAVVHYNCSWLNEIFGPITINNLPIPVEVLPPKNLDS